MTVIPPEQPPAIPTPAAEPSAVVVPPPGDPTPATPGVPAGWYKDSASGRVRWWNGTAWTENFQSAPGTSGFALAALILGICGFLLTGIPFFIGLFLGTLPNILAIVFGIIVLSRQPIGSAKVMAIVAICLSGVSLLSIFVGAGTVW